MSKKILLAIDTIKDEKFLTKCHAILSAGATNADYFTGILFDYDNLVFEIRKEQAETNPQPTDNTQMQNIPMVSRFIRFQVPLTAENLHYLGSLIYRPLVGCLFIDNRIDKFVLLDGLLLKRLQTDLHNGVIDVRGRFAGSILYAFQDGKVQLLDPGLSGIDILRKIKELKESHLEAIERTSEPKQQQEEKNNV